MMITGKAYVSAWRNDSRKHRIQNTKEQSAEIQEIFGSCVFYDTSRNRFKPIGCMYIHVEKLGGI